MCKKPLTQDQLNSLYSKTEGWVVGLQLAGSSLAASADVDQFIASFAGINRHVLHFLSEEVLNNEPEFVQDFLLQTSILGRFNAALCNAVTGRTDCAELLAGLERDNLFVIPLDNQGNWYRYHSLFADLLFHRLKREAAGQVDDLHKRAASWYVSVGMPGEAVRHALASEDWDIVDQILHNHYEAVIRSEGAGQSYQCLNKLPVNLLRKYPRLIAQKAFSHLLRQGTESARECLEMAGGLSYPNPDEQQEFAGMLAAVNTYLHVFDHDFPKALSSAAEALMLLPSRNYYWRMLIGVFSGDARLFAGNPKGAYPLYLDAHTDSKMLNNTFAYLTTGFKVGTSLYYQGRLGDAEEYARKLLVLAREEGLSRMPRVGLLWPLLGDILREKGDLAEAERCVERGLIYNEAEKPSLGWNYLSAIAVAVSQQKYQEALLLFSEVENVHRDFGLPAFVTSPAVAWKARILLVQGDITGAREALASANIKETAPVQGGKERGFLVLARILLQEGKLDQVADLLMQVEQAADKGGYKRLYVETQLARADMEIKKHSPEAAEYCVVSALNIGVESGFFQTFIDEGRELDGLWPRVLEGLADKPELAELAAAVFEKLSPDSAQAAPGTPTGNRDQGLVEELSKRELTVLNLISQGLSNQEVSEKLILSPGTIKWYTSNIYGKLGVKNRAQAVIRARELNLLS